MAYAKPRVRSLSQYLMGDDRPRASALKSTRASRAACAPARARSRPTRRSACRSRSRTTARTDVLWGLVRQYRAGDVGHDPGRPEGARRGWRKLARRQDDGLRRSPPRAHSTARASATACWLDLAGRQALHRRLRPLSYGGGLDDPSQPGRSSDWGLDPMRRQWAAADPSITMRTLRMHLLGLDVADVNGRVARAGRRHVPLRRRRRARDGRAAPAALRRAADAARSRSCALEDGRLRRALHAASGRGLARRSARAATPTRTRGARRPTGTTRSHAVAARA